MEDGYAGLHALPSSALKSIIRIQFTNALGVAEAGVDGGGLFEDFLDDLVKESFSPERGLFTVCITVLVNMDPPCLLCEHVNALEKSPFELTFLELPTAVFPPRARPLFTC